MLAGFGFGVMAGHRVTIVLHLGIGDSPSAEAMHKEHSPMTTAQLRTSGDIARELGSKVSRVRYILDTREHIRPIARAGIVRL